MNKKYKILIKPLNPNLNGYFITDNNSKMRMEAFTYKLLRKQTLAATLSSTTSSGTTPRSTANDVATSLNKNT